MNVVLPGLPELVFAALALLAMAAVVAVLVGLLVAFVARRTLGDEQRRRQLVQGAVGVVLAVFAVALLTRLTGAPATRVLVAVPGVVAAVLLVVLGLTLAPVARSLTHRGLARLRPGVADVAAPLVYWLVLGLALLLAADQLGVETRLVQQLLVLVVGGLALAMALALGLGSRELVAAVVAGRHVAQIVAVGDRVGVDGHEGIVEALGHASVRLSIEGGEVEVPNRCFLDGAVVVLERAPRPQPQPSPHPPPAPPTAQAAPAQAPQAPAPPPPPPPETPPPPAPETTAAPPAEATADAPARERPSEPPPAPAASEATQPLPERDNDQS